MKMIVTLSRHSKPRTRRSKLVSGHGSPPAGSISQSWVDAAFSFFSGGGRVLRKAIRFPSGDQRGDACEWSPRVS